MIEIQSREIHVKLKTDEGKIAKPVCPNLSSLPVLLKIVRADYPADDNCNDNCSVRKGFFKIRKPVKRQRKILLTRKRRGAKWSRANPTPKKQGGHSKRLLVQDDIQPFEEFKTTHLGGQKVNLNVP
ncbi:hypothetical protein Fcan01_09086 [Folsomia candida]|uniref:Uncharacterized protein n=1 Tax=Folsomia candida TaxID=158441 RepID=A0A226EEX6_FOLCA|nr:hypothetical protein Fcan01_09086 [Folsomia candida]